MSDPISFSLGDIISKDGKPKIENQNISSSEIEDSSNSEIDSAFSDVLSESPELEQEESIEEQSPEEKKSQTLHLKERNKRPSLNERQLKKLQEKDARIKALETALLEKKKKEETLRKVGQELYKYGSLKDQETIEREEYILNSQLRDAKYDGDVEKELEISGKLRDLSAQKTKLNSSLPEYLQDPEEEENYFGDNYYQEDTADSLQNPAMAEWMEANPWLNIPHLRKKAEDVMETLEGELAFDGKMDIIGTPQFFKEVSNRVRAQVKKGKMQASGKYGTQPPIPVSNGGGTIDMSSQYEEKEPWRNIKLTPDEIDTAVRTLGFVEQQKGKPLTKMQKIERMKQYLYRIRQSNDKEIKLWQ